MKDLHIPGIFPSQEVLAVTLLVRRVDDRVQELLMIKDWGNNGDSCLEGVKVDIIRISSFFISLLTILFNSYNFPSITDCSYRNKLLYIYMNTENEKDVGRRRSLRSFSYSKSINKTQVASVQLGKTLDLNLYVFSFLPRDRVKCGRLGWVWVMFLSLVGLVSVCAKFRLPSLSKSGLKVPGGVVVGWCGGWGPF